MGKFCPIVGHDVVYLVCQECEDRVCEQSRPRVTVLPKKTVKQEEAKKPPTVKDDRCRGNCPACETCCHKTGQENTVLGNKEMLITHCEVYRNYLIDSIKVSHDGCEYHNKDLSKERICLNCKKFIGGSDWGLSCAQNYHTLTQPLNPACEHFDNN